MLLGQGQEPQGLGTTHRGQMVHTLQQDTEQKAAYVNDLSGACGDFLLCLCGKLHSNTATLEVMGNYPDKSKHAVEGGIYLHYLSM